VTATFNLANRPPSAKPFKPTHGDYCKIRYAHAFFKWEFIDTDSGDYQTAKQIRIYNADDNSLVHDSKKIIGIPGRGREYATEPGVLQYGKTYKWELKVWDSSDLDSNWIPGPSFATPEHAYPEIDFSWSPQTPGVNEDVLFTDKSTVYGGTTKQSWSWTFQDGSPAASNEQNPTVKFSSIGEKLITLEVTDSTDPDGFTCPGSKTLNAEFPLPKWKEIAPF